MKSLLWLHTSVIQDLGSLLGVETTRDVETLTSRVLAEGDSFLTITLPTFEDALLASLESGKIDLSSFGSFKSRGCLPVFLRGFTDRVFDQHGCLRSDCDVECIRAIRQVCSLSKKVERDVSPDRLKKAELAFVRTDAEVPLLSDWDSALVQRFQSVASHLFCGVSNLLEDAIASFSLVPRHGPGAVAEAFSRQEKWEFPEWYESIDSCFPSTLYTHHNGLCSPLPAVSPGDESPVRVVFVPKTMKTPRVIAIEPSCRQYVQQAVSRLLYKELRRSYPASLDLFDQGTNRAWAEYGSGTGEVSTLDLSEASDRLSMDLPALMFRGFPLIREALTACRSRQAQLPSGDIISLRKFASMGSALTFPVQSMVFFTIAVMGLMEARQLKSVPHDTSCVSVFGDDIVVPTDSTPFVRDLLQAFGLKVNTRKSFSTGKFRESCGADFYDGLDVSIVRLRRDLPSSRRDCQGIAAAVSFRNFCYVRGLWNTARELDSLLENLIMWRPGRVGSATLSRSTYLHVPPERVSPTLHRDEVRRPVLKPVLREYKVDGLRGLLGWFLKGNQDFVSPYAATERPVAFTINNRWTDLHS